MEPSAEERATARAEFSAAMGFAVQGDLQSAIPHFKSIPLDGLSENGVKVTQGILSRFGDAAPEESGTDDYNWVQKVSSAYHHYWRQVLLGLVNPEKGELNLARSLAPLTGDPSIMGKVPNMDTIEEALKKSFEAQRYHVLFGVTKPFRDFMLWRTQTNVDYSIELPEGREDVHVAMLDDFISYGWLGFATFNYYHTGGWTKPDRLYCVRSSYDLNSENFRVSYLAHEAQHFSDKKRFPLLEPPELEYRAKLVEIALAQTNLYGLLKVFSANKSEDRNRPHSYANRRLVNDLTAAFAPNLSEAPEWWANVPTNKINEISARLLKEDTVRLQSNK